MAIMAETKVKQLRLSVGATQEDIIRRTRSVSLSTIRSAEQGKRITYDTATQLLEAINSLLTDAGRRPITLDDLDVTLF